MDTATHHESRTTPPPIREHAAWYRRLHRLARARPGPAPPPATPGPPPDPDAALARHAARLAAELDRAEAAREQEAAEARAEEAIRLGERLLEMDDAPRPRGRRAGPDEPPGVLLRRLLGTAEGCRWLLDRWMELAALLELGVPWGPADLRRLVRLLGKRPLEAAYDPELNSLLGAFDGPWPGTAEAFLACCLDRLPAGDPALRDLQPWRPMFETPEGMDGCRESVLAVMERHVARIAALRDAHAGDGQPVALAVADADAARRERLQLARVRELRLALAHRDRKPATAPAPRPDRPRPGLARLAAGTQRRTGRAREPAAVATS